MSARGVEPDEKGHLNVFPTTPHFFVFCVSFVVPLFAQKSNHKEPKEHSDLPAR